MTLLDAFTLVVLLVLIVGAAFVAYELGGLPGRVAAGRGHAHSDAVRVAGWLGLLTVGLLWPLALIWAYATPRRAAEGSGSEVVADDLEETLASLRDRVQVLEKRIAGGRGTPEEGAP